MNTPNTSAFASAMVASPNSTAATSLQCSGAPPQQLLVAVRMAHGELNARIRHLETDSRKVEQRLEKRLALQLEEFRTSQARDTTGTGGGRVADLAGTMAGLMDEMKELTQRVDGLDKRLWDRTGGAEAHRQRGRELEQQVQALEHQGRLSVAASEEAQRRQVAKHRRTEHNIEELTRRLLAAEEELSARFERPGDDHLEARFGALEQQHEHHEANVRSLKAHIEETLRATRSANIAGREEASDSAKNAAADASLAILERRMTKQLEDQATTLASLRVKADGQAQRAATLAERLQTAHEPAIEALRQELQQFRAQDWQRIESELVQLRAGARAVAEEAAAEEADAAAAARGAARQQHAELTAHLWALDQRLDNELADFRAALQKAGEGGMHPSATGSSHRDLDLDEIGGLVARAEEGEACVEELRRHMEHLQGAVDQLLGDGVVEKVDHLQAAVEQLSKEDMVLWRLITDQESKVDALSHAFSGFAQPGGGFYNSFAGTNEPSGVQDASHQGSPPDDSGSSVQDAHWEAGNKSSDDLETELPGERQRSDFLRREVGVVDERLRAVDELAHRVADLERRALANVSPEVAATGSRPPPPGLRDLSRDVSELQARLLASKMSLQTENSQTELMGSRSHDSEADLAPREDEIVALAERVQDAEEEFNDHHAAHRGLGHAWPPSLDGGGACQSGRSHSEGGGSSRNFGAEVTLPGHVLQHCVATPRDCEDIFGDADNFRASFLGEHLGALETVLRRFAGQLEGVHGEGGCGQGPAENEVLRQLEELKAQGSHSWGGLVELRRDLDEARDVMGELSERVVAARESAGYAQHQSEQSSAECKALAKKLRSLQERDVRGLGQNMHELKGSVGMANERLDIVERVTMALKERVFGDTGRARHPGGDSESGEA